MSAQKPLADWFSNTVVIRLAQPEQAAMVFNRLSELGVHVGDERPCVASAPLLAIGITRRGEATYFFLGLDTPDALPEEHTVSVSEFMAFPLAPTRELILRNIQRKAKERTASEQLFQLSRLDTYRLTDEQLALVDSLYQTLNK